MGSIFGEARVRRGSGRLFVSARQWAVRALALALHPPPAPQRVLQSSDHGDDGQDRGGGVGGGSGGVAGRAVGGVGGGGVGGGFGGADDPDEAGYSMVPSDIFTKAVGPRGSTATRVERVLAYGLPHIYEAVALVADMVEELKCTMGLGMSRQGVEPSPGVAKRFVTLRHATPHPSFP